ASDDRYEVTQQRNPDAACLDCHKPDIEGMHGKHASVINPNNKLPVTCSPTLYIGSLKRITSFTPSRCCGDG
ncbi:hypothetical protein ACUODJ_61545, partial [Escherichia sp. HC-CC]